MNARMDSLHSTAGPHDRIVAGTLFWDHLPNTSSKEFHRQKVIFMNRQIRGNRHMWIRL